MIVQHGENIDFTPKIRFFRKAKTTFQKNNFYVAKSFMKKGLLIL
jgi:hypothetical protein